MIDTYAEYVIRVHGPSSIVVLMITLHIINNEAYVCRSRTATTISVNVQKGHRVSVSKELFIFKKEYAKQQFISRLSHHYALADADHRIAKVAFSSNLL